MSGTFSPAVSRNRQTGYRRNEFLTPFSGLNYLRRFILWLVLITGGCGFVGTNLADALLEQGEQAAVLDNLSGRGARDNLRWLRARHGLDWTMIEADVRDAGAAAAAVRKLRPRFVAHLAGQVAMTTSLANPRLDFETNALGTFNVLEAIRLGSPDTALLYSSTNKVYGSLEELRYGESPTRYVLADHPAGLEESLPLDGSSPYGCSKLCADQYCRDYHRMYGLKTVVFRHSSMYGGRQFASEDQGWIGWFCGEAISAAISNRPISICGNGKQVRDVLHASDLVQVYLQASRRIDDIAGRIYNIGGGMANSLSLVELLTHLGSLIGAKLSVKSKPWRAADQKVFVADCRRAERDFGWRPRTEYRQGLAEMLDWIREPRRHAATKRRRIRSPHKTAWEKGTVLNFAPRTPQKWGQSPAVLRRGLHNDIALIMQPKVSILIPVYNRPEQSVRRPFAAATTRRRIRILKSLLATMPAPTTLGPSSNDWRPTTPECRLTAMQPISGLPAIGSRRSLIALATTSKFSGRTIGSNRHSLKNCCGRCSIIRTWRSHLVRRWSTWRIATCRSIFLRSKLGLARPNICGDRSWASLMPVSPARVDAPRGRPISPANRRKSSVEPDRRAIRRGS